MKQRWGIALNQGENLNAGKWQLLSEKIEIANGDIFKHEILPG